MGSLWAVAHDGNMGDRAHGMSYHSWAFQSGKELCSHAPREGINQITSLDRNQEPTVIGIGSLGKYGMH